MPCLCETYECLELPIRACNAWVELPITATVSGEHRIRVEFNGVAQIQMFTAVQGEKYIVPNLFNGQYVHKVLIYPPDAIDPVCYKIRTMPASWHIPLPYPPTSGGSEDLFLIVAVGDAPALQNGITPLGPYSNGTTFVIPELIGATIEDLRVGPTNVEPVAGGYAFDSATGTLTFDFLVEDNNIYIEAEVESDPPVEISTVTLDPTGMDTISIDLTTSDNFELV